MKVKGIIPCVCIDHKPDASDKTTYGMPHLTVAKSLQSDKEFWQIWCPECGRGGMAEFYSQYYALNAWNEMQLKLWEIECCLPWTTKIDPEVPQWRRDMYQEIREIYG